MPKSKKTPVKNPANTKDVVETTPNKSKVSKDPSLTPQEVKICSPLSKPPTPHPSRTAKKSDETKSERQCITQLNSKKVEEALKNAKEEIGASETMATMPRMTREQRETCEKMYEAIQMEDLIRLQNEQAEPTKTTKKLSPAKVIDCTKLASESRASCLVGIETKAKLCDNPDALLMDKIAEHESNLKAILKTSPNKVVPSHQMTTAKAAISATKKNENMTNMMEAVLGERSIHHPVCPRQEILVNEMWAILETHMSHDSMNSAKTTKYRDILAKVCKSRSFSDARLVLLDCILELDRKEALEIVRVVRRCGQATFPMYRMRGASRDGGWSANPSPAIMTAHLVKEDNAKDADTEGK